MNAHAFDSPESTSKTIYSLGNSPRSQWQIYDLATDPGEHSPASGFSMPLRRMAVEEQRAMRDRNLQRAHRKVVLPPDLRQRLEALGYLRQKGAETGRGGAIE